MLPEELPLNQPIRHLSDRGAEGWISFLTACRNGDFMTVRELCCSQFQDVNYEFQEDNGNITGGLFERSHALKGLSPLRLACEFGHADIVRFLLDHGFTTNDEGHFGPTTQSKGTFTTMRHTVDVYDQDGKTGMLMAAHNGHADVVRILLGVGGNPDREDCIYGETPLYLACKGANPGIVSVLLDAGADPNKGTRNGDTPLSVACRLGLISIVQLLLRDGKGLQINNRSPLGETPLYIAATEGHCTILRMLLEQKGIDVNMAEGSGYTPLHIAVQNGHTDVVQGLLDAGADNVTAMNGLTPLCISILSHDFIIARRILMAKPETSCHVSHIDRSTPLHRASERGSIDIVRALIEYGADISRKDCFGQTPLHKSVNSGKVDVVQLLMQSSDEMKIAIVNEPDDEGSTPLHLATHQGHYEIVQLLVSYVNTTVDQKDNGGRTALSIACENSNADIVKILVKTYVAGQNRSGIDSLRVQLETSYAQC